MNINYLYKFLPKDSLHPIVIETACRSLPNPSVSLCPLRLDRRGSVAEPRDSCLQATVS